MKKWMKLSFGVMAAVLVATGCGKSEETKPSADQAKELTDQANISLGNYKGLELTAERNEVTEEEVQKQLELLCFQYPVTIEGRPAQNGDTVNIDYEGKKDGVAFDGGTAQGFDLTLGSGSFIDGFEDGVVGMSVGEERDLNLTFPEQYHSEELAGQAVVFHVKLNAILSPESTPVDDSLAQRVLGEDQATLDDLKDQVGRFLESQEESRFFNAAGTELLSQVIENSDITVDPDAVDQMYGQLTATYASYASQYGLELDQFLSMFLGTDKEGLNSNAELLVKQEMVLKEIIRTEGLKPTAEQQLQLAKMNNFATADDMVASYGEESANQLFDMGAAYYFLIENAVRSEGEASK